MSQSIVQEVFDQANIHSNDLSKSDIEELIETFEEALFLEEDIEFGPIGKKRNR